MAQNGQVTAAMSSTQVLKPARTVVLVTGLVDDISPALDVLALAGLDAGWRRKGRVPGYAPGGPVGDPTAHEIFCALAGNLQLNLPDCCLPESERLGEACTGPVFQRAVDYLEARLGGTACVALVDAGFGWLPTFWQTAAAAAGAKAVFVALAAPLNQTADDIGADHGLDRPRALMTWGAYYWRLMRRGGPGAYIFDHDFTGRFPRHSAARLVDLLKLERVVALDDEAIPRRTDGAFSKAWRQQDEQLLRPLPRLVVLVREAISTGTFPRVPAQPFESVVSFYCGLNAYASPTSIGRPDAQGSHAAPETVSPDRDQPFFMVGAPRSGTTLLRNLLRQHPSLLAPEETHFFRWANPAGSDEYNNRYRQQPVLKRHRELDGVSEDDFRNLVEQAGDRHDLMEGYAAMFRTGSDDLRTRWFDKSPQNVYGLPLIMALYPRSCIVHIHRHPVEVAASAMAGRSIAKHSLKGATNLWLEPMQIIDTLRPLLKERLIELGYDDLVHKPRTVLKQLGAALGLKPFRFDTSAVSAERGPQVSQRMMDSDDIAYVESRCAAYMTAYGYRSRLT